MTMDTTMTRRALLGAGAAGAGAAALAACTSSTSGGGSKAQTSGHKLVALADVPVGGAAAVTLADGSPAVVARPSAGAAACFSAICTHNGCTVAVKGKQLDCPCHQSRFNAFTGAVLQGPASSPLPKIPVKVSGGEVVTA